VIIFLKNLGDLMVSYLKSSRKHTSDISYIDFKLYSNIVVPSWVDLVDSCTGPNIGVMEAYFRIS
jgi:hypothetical protein